MGGDGVDAVLPNQQAGYSAVPLMPLLPEEERGVLEVDETIAKEYQHC